MRKCLSSGISRKVLGVLSYTKYMCDVLRPILILLSHRDPVNNSGNTFLITKTCPCNEKRFILSLKTENFQLKILDIFLIFAQNIDCGYSLEYPQSMF